MALYTQRPDIHTYYMEMAQVASTRGTCPRRKVGCILIDCHNRVLSVGYNGVAAGQPHCFESPCKGINMPTGTGLDLCEALHAEQSALLICRDVHAIEAAYVTTSPCMTCVKLLLNTSCKRIYYGEKYEGHFIEVEKIWQRSGRQLIHHPYEVK